MHVKVLQHHIDRGERGNAFHCPIAQALREQFPDVEKVSVGSVIYVGENKVGGTPQDAAEWICAFDRGKHVEPFEFDIVPIFPE